MSRGFQGPVYFSTHFRVLFFPRKWSLRSAKSPLNKVKLDSKTIVFRGFNFLKGLQYIQALSIFYDTFANVPLLPMLCLHNYIQLFRERLSRKVHSTIPKGIVDGFEFTVLQRNFRECHERSWIHVSEC